MGWTGYITYFQFRCLMIWERVKAGERLDLDMDGYVPKEKQEEWKRALEMLPWTGLEARARMGPAFNPETPQEGQPQGQALPKVNEGLLANRARADAARAARMAREK